MTDPETNTRTPGSGAPAEDLVLKELNRLLRQICGQTSPEVVPGTRLEDIAGLDSLRLLQAVAHLEDFFNVEIDPGALETLDRVSDVVSAVTSGQPIETAGARRDEN